jgi:hypothetical protein
MPVFFNLHGAVGEPPALNNREDVLLVQFAFYVMGLHPLKKTGAALVAAARSVQMTGSVDRQTIAAIRALQADLKSEYPGQVVDGRVSPAKGGISYGSGAYWTISCLNGVFRGRYRDLWPRVDKVPGCPGEVQQMVRREVVGP